MTRTHSIGRTMAVCSVIAGIVALAGCGVGGAAKGKVKGKVTANGQPVTAGAVIMQPAPGVMGTQASGGVNADGTFEISTEKPGDGAAIGKHTVSYSPPGDEQPEWDGYGTPPPVKVSPYKNLVSSVSEFEVKAGENELNIELVPAGAAR
jgi:hypothetical protein